MSPFREWYERRYGIRYPGEAGERDHVVHQRMADGFAEYVDAVVKELREKAEGGSRVD